MVSRTTGKHSAFSKLLCTHKNSLFITAAQKLLLLIFSGEFEVESVLICKVLWISLVAQLLYSYYAQLLTCKPVFSIHCRALYFSHSSKCSSSNLKHRRAFTDLLCHGRLFPTTRHTAMAEGGRGIKFRDTGQWKHHSVEFACWTVKLLWGIQLCSKSQPTTGVYRESPSGRNRYVLLVHVLIFLP